jgi:hypothetical protein
MGLEASSVGLVQVVDGSGALNASCGRCLDLFGAFVGDVCIAWAEEVVRAERRSRKREGVFVGGRELEGHGSVCKTALKAQLRRKGENREEERR